MTTDQYLQTVISRNSRTPIQISDPRLNPIITSIKNWAGIYLKEIKLSGSSAKNVVISGEADTDLFIALKSDTPNDLRFIYNSLAQWLMNHNFPVTKKTVAIETKSNNLKIDLVPGRLQSGYQIWYSLYNSNSGNWLQTNIDSHINDVINSGRRDEIRIIKIWCKNHNLKFPSIYLEQVIFEALFNRNKNQLGTNVITILRYLSHDFQNKKIVDPSNSNNILSDYLLSMSQKRIIAEQAMKSLYEQYWEKIVW